MWRKTKLIMILMFVAFIIGFSPTIIRFLSDALIYSAGKLSLHPHIVAVINSFVYILKHYAWHIMFVYALIVAFMIFMEGQNPDRTILWMFVLVFVPVLGLIIYFIIGPDPENYTKRKSFRLAKATVDNTPFTSDRRYAIGKLLHSCSGANLLIHNRVKILINGDETFSAIKDALQKAEHYIHMEFFIIKDDEIGREIRDVLLEVAKRGVKIRVLYDAIGSWSLTKKYVDTLIDAGIECHSFTPVSFARFRRKMNFRNHRKIIVIDSKIAFTGGLNIGDEYLGKGPLGHWRDTHVELEGECVAELHKIFLDDWCFRTGENPDKIDKNLSCANNENDFEIDHSSLPIVPLQVVESDASDAWHTISQGYFSMITKAKSRIWITTPYLVPGPSLMTAIANAALAGVDVRIIVPSTKDHFLVFWASRNNYAYLLRAGVKIFLYEKGFVHAKSLVMDNNVCSVGTCNMDVRSLEINFENQLFIYNEETTEQLAEQFEKDFDDSHQLDLNEWTKRPLWQKVFESFGKLYSAQI